MYGHKLRLLFSGIAITLEGGGRFRGVSFRGGAHVTLIIVVQRPFLPVLHCVRGGALVSSYCRPFLRNLCVIACIIFIFVFHCTHVRMSYALNCYLLTLKNKADDNDDGDDDAVVDHD